MRGVLILHYTEGRARLRFSLTNPCLPREQSCLGRIARRCRQSFKSKLLEIELKVQAKPSVQDSRRPQQSVVNAEPREVRE